MARKWLDSKFINSVPEVVEQTQDFVDRTLRNPAIPYPWAPYAPSPRDIERSLADMQRIYQACGDPTIRTGGDLGRARKALKVLLAKLARYVALTLKESGSPLSSDWPGFDSARTPGERRPRIPYRQPPAVVQMADDN